MSLINKEIADSFNCGSAAALAVAVPAPHNNETTVAESTSLRLKLN